MSFLSSNSEPVLFPVRTYKYRTRPMKVRYVCMYHNGATTADSIQIFYCI